MLNGASASVDSSIRHEETDDGSTTSHQRPDDRDARPATDVQVAEIGRSKRSAASTSAVGSGEIFGFLGPNGAGKTTTLRMLATLLTPTSGEATVAGADLRREPQHGPRADRLRPPGRLDRSGRDRPRRARHPGPAVRHAASPTRRRGQRRCSSPSTSRRPPTGRPAPTRAACGAASTSGSASSTGRRSCSSTSRRPASTRRPGRGCGTRSGPCASSGTTVFLTTHYLEEADALCDRLAIIDHGKIVAEGTADELKRQVAGDVVTIGVDGATEHVLETVRQPAVRARGDRARTASSGSTSTMARRRSRSCSGCSTAPGSKRPRSPSHRPSLDDVFLRQTGRSLREEAA